MNKHLTALLVVILCMALAVTFGMTAMATESGDGSSEGGSASSEQITSSETDSVSTSTSSDSETSSGDETNSESGASSGDETSSGDENSSNEGTSSDSTSSGTTSSKVNKPIYSGGDADGNKFVEQDFSSGTSSTTSSTVSTTSSSITVSDEPIGDEYVDDPEHDDHFQGQATTVAGDIYKIIWIPAVISVLCIAALITVNVMFKKKYPKGQKSGSSHEGPHRRKSK